jgi:hypothetical protein
LRRGYYSSNWKPALDILPPSKWLAINKFSMQHAGRREDFEKKPILQQGLERQTNPDRNYCATKETERRTLILSENNGWFSCWCYVTKRQVNIKGELQQGSIAEILTVKKCSHEESCPQVNSHECLLGKRREGKFCIEERRLNQTSEGP